MQKHKPNWLPIEGTAEITDSLITYRSENVRDSTKKSTRAGTKKSAELDEEVSETLLRSDTYFESGDITGEVKLSDPQLCVRVRLGSVSGTWTTVGFNAGGATYGLGTYAMGQSRIIDTSGQGSKLPVDHWLKFRIRVRGSHLEFFVQDVRVLQGNVSLLRAQLELRLRGEGVAEVRNLVVEAIRPQAFVVMQFTDEYTALYREVIQPVCSHFGYEVIRGDNVYTNGLIIEDIARSIRECSIVIADITPNNANVYYELGFAHGIGKPAILLSDRNREKLPFDISGFRLLFYDNTIGGKGAVEESLRKHLEAIRGS